MAMPHYYDTHNQEIKEGMYLRCLTNNEIVEVVNLGNDLGILGLPLNGKQGAHSLMSFCWAYFIDNKLHLIDFEIVK